MQAGVEPAHNGFADRRVPVSPLHEMAPADGIEPPLPRSERSVLPLNEAGNGQGERNRTSATAFQVRDSTIELHPVIGLPDRTRTCILRVRSTALIQFSYGKNWLALLDSNQPFPVNSRTPSPRWFSANNLVEQPGSAPGASILQGSTAP